MPWDLLGDVPVRLDAAEQVGPLIGDELIKVEHTYDFASFPGTGYALISDLYSNDEQLEFIRSYPYKDRSRIYALEIPQVMKDAGWLLRYLLIRRNRRARVDADANWRVKIYVWVGTDAPETPIDGNSSSPDDDPLIFDGGT